MKTVLASEPGILVTLSNGRVSLSLADSFQVDLDNKEILFALQQYAAKKTILFPVNEDSFQGEVWRYLTSIPFGKTVSYQEIAIALQHPKAYRAVGNACGKNPFPLLVPCHRVIATDGSLGGFSSGIEIKKRLLAFEKPCL